MNKKGFTLVEIIVTFCLVSTISFLLFQLIISLKNLYTNSDLKTVLMIDQGNMTRRMNDDFFTMPIVSINDCEDTDDAGLKLCYSFNLNDQALEKVVTKQLKIYDDRIIYDGFQINIANGSKLGDVSLVATYIEDTTVKYNGILTLDIPISNKLVLGDFGIHMTVQYNTSKSNVPPELLDDYKKISIVTTTVADIKRKLATTGTDGLYSLVGETEWYSSSNVDLPKFVFKGSLPNNFVIFNNKCYRIIYIANDDSIKMIYDSDANEDRCDVIDSAGNIGTSVFSSDANTNNWYGAKSSIRNNVLPSWVKNQNMNTDRISLTSNFYAGAVSEVSKSVKELFSNEFINRGDSSLPDKTAYSDHGNTAGIPMISDYLLASLNSNCITLNDAFTKESCGRNNYMFKNYDYWTMNADDSGETEAWYISSNGKVEKTSVDNSSIYVRPVIFLKASTKFSGEGTQANPYVVK